MTATAYVLVAGRHDRLVGVALAELREAMADALRGSGMCTGEKIVNFDGAAARGGRTRHTATIGGL